MAELVDSFAGKVNGELVRADDWNGLIAAIETKFTGLETALDARIDALEARATAAEARLDALTASVAPLAGLATMLRQRYRRMDLTTARTTFAVGERGEIIARITDFDGAAMDLSQAASRPWVDFITVWGSLKAVSGFASQGGLGGRTVSVQVNAQGEARVLLRADQADSLAEEQELEVNAVLQTTIGTASVAQHFLNAPTPASDALIPAYQAISTAYDRTDTRIMQGYVDAYHVRNSVLTYTPQRTIYTMNWRDEHVTVLAFLKPDANPGTADGAQAIGSIQVTFRDWIYPWTVGHYLTPEVTLVQNYRDRFAVEIGPDFGVAVKGVFDVIKEKATDRGILGRQKELTAAQQALDTLPVNSRPNYMEQLLGSVGGGLMAQQGMLYSQAISPMMMQDLGPGQAIGMATAAGQVAASAEGKAIRSEVASSLGASEARITDNVAAQQKKFSEDLVSATGPVGRVELLANEAHNVAQLTNKALNNKADISVVGQLLNARAIT